LMMAMQSLTAAYSIGVSRLIQFVVVGRLRPPLADAGAEFEKRIARMADLQVHEVAAEPVQHGDDQVFRREGDRMRAKVAQGAHVVAMDSRGTAPASSEALASWMGRRLEDARPTCFFIGGAIGLDPSLAADADEVMSLGPLTLPHQLARVVLAEQVYRSLADLAGHPYPRAGGAR
ncbi:MAG: 23S rRNA (pseudouridine(1915)-N(3))-methyltransferase RlmH, partial [Actinobacteria bacterium]|nr:23S rRNA (pseudouridine(1915)-N(3))-methyltransferase RlmH [Actinomycetota bacterium]